MEYRGSGCKGRAAFILGRGARRPEAPNPDYWAIDACAFSIPGKWVFMSKGEQPVITPSRAT